MRRRSNSRSARRIWLLIAASVLVALGVAYIWPEPANKNNPVAPIASASAQPAHNHAPSPAMLGRLADCVWESDMKPLRVGQDIAAGTTIDIKSGLAQLVFESGAEVVLKGPCRLRVENPCCAACSPETFPPRCRIGPPASRFVGRLPK